MKIQTALNTNEEMPKPRGSDEVIGKHQAGASALGTHLIPMLTCYHFLSNGLVNVPRFLDKMDIILFVFEKLFFLYQNDLLKDRKEALAGKLDNHL